MEGSNQGPTLGPLGSPLRKIPRSVLWAASLLYGFGVRLRLLFYRKGLFHPLRPPVKVLSIGNLTVGGAGKTPHAALLAQYLRDKGIRTAVVSRGYGGKKTKPGAVLSDGRTILVTWKEGGEEPLWLAKRLPGVPVLVGRDRFRSAVYAQQTWQIEWIVLDDGFQYLNLPRDLDILLVPAHEPFQAGRLFPLGSLREPKEEIKRADVILLTHAERTDDIVRTRQKEIIGRLAPYAPIYCSFHRPARLRVHPWGKKLPLSFLKGKKVLAFCGLGDPGSFVHSLEEVGAETVHLVPFRDHHLYREKDKAVLEGLCREFMTSWLVTTEKDAIKLEGWTPKGAELLVLGVEVEIPDRGFWELLARVVGRGEEG